MEQLTCFPGCMRSCNVGISGPLWLGLTTLAKEAHLDPVLKEVRRKLESGAPGVSGFELRNAILLYHGMFVISSNSSMIPQILNKLHSSPMGRHLGAFCT